MLAFLLASTLAAASAAPLTGEQVFVRSMTAMRGAPRPQKAHYREDYVGSNVRPLCGEGDEGGTAFDIDPLSRGNFARSYAVSMTNSGAVAVARDLTSAKTCDATGFLSVFPAGLDVFGKKRAHENTGTQFAGLKIIGSVSAYASTGYTITISGHEVVNGRDCYRLTLVPRVVSDDYPLREVLVDADTFLMHRIKAEFYDREGIGAGRGAAELDFNRAGPYWVVEKMDIRIRIAVAIFIRRDLRLQLTASDFSFQ